MSYIEYTPPAGWHPSVMMGVEMFGSSSTLSGMPLLRCEICKIELGEFTYICPDEACRTIISMKEPEEYRLKSIAVPPMPGVQKLIKRKPRPIKKVR